MGCFFSVGRARTQLGALVAAGGWAGARRWAGVRLWGTTTAVSPAQQLSEAAATLERLWPEPASKPGLVVGIDYTASNFRNGARTFGGRCLHTIALTGGRARENFYERALRACAPLHAACGAPAVAVYGFGDVHTADARVFSFLPDDAACAQLGDVVARYREITPGVVLGGPTSFVASIERACARVEAARRPHALILVVDDPPANTRANLEALVAASRLALYIVAVGVGDSAFLGLRELERTAALDCNFANLALVLADEGAPGAGGAVSVEAAADARCLALAARIAQAVAAQAVAAREAGAQFG